MNKHPLSGKSIKITLLAPHPRYPRIKDGDMFEVENWAGLVNPQIMNTMEGVIFITRLEDMADLEQAVYGKIGPFGYILLHDELTG